MWNLVPRPGIEPTTPASHRECTFLPTGQPREVPPMALLIMKCEAKVVSKMEAFDLSLPKGKDVSHGIDWSRLRSVKEQERQRSRRWLGSELPWAEGKAPEEMFQQQNCSGARCRGARGWSRGPEQGHGFRTPGAAPWKPSARWPWASPKHLGRIKGEALRGDWVPPWAEETLGAVVRVAPTWATGEGSQSPALPCGKAGGPQLPWAFS